MRLKFRVYFVRFRFFSRAGAGRTEGETLSPAPETGKILCEIVAADGDFAAKCLLFMDSLTKTNLIKLTCSYESTSIS